MVWLVDIAVKLVFACLAGNLVALDLLLLYSPWSGGYYFNFALLLGWEPVNRKQNWLLLDWPLPLAAACQILLLHWQKPPDHMMLLPPLQLLILLLPLPLALPLPLLFLPLHVPLPVHVPLPLPLPLVSPLPSPLPLPLPLPLPPPLQLPLPLRLPFAFAFAAAFEFPPLDPFI